MNTGTQKQRAAWLIESYARLRARLTCATRPDHGCPNSFWSVRRLYDACVLRAWAMQPLVHSRLCRFLCARFSVWLPPRRVVVWARRGRLVTRCLAPVASPGTRVSRMRHSAMVPWQHCPI